LERLKDLKQWQHIWNKENPLLKGTLSKKCHETWTLELNPMLKVSLGSKSNFFLWRNCKVWGKVWIMLSLKNISGMICICVWRIILKQEEKPKEAAKFCLMWRKSVRDPWDPSQNQLNNALWFWTVTLFNFEPKDQIYKRNTSQNFQLLNEESLIISSWTKCSHGLEFKHFQSIFHLINCWISHRRRTCFHKWTLLQSHAQNS
jgi:hypothetical protein